MKFFSLKNVCIVFGICSIGFMIVDYFNIVPNFSGYLCNLAVEFIGVIITLVVIQKVLDKHNEKKEKQAERKNILQRNEILAIYIEFYQKFFHCVVTPLSNRFENNTFTIPIEFTIRDIKDLYKMSGYVTNALLKPSIELFFIHEENLRKAFISTINSIEFKHYPKIQKLMLEYIKNSVRDDMRDFILNNKQTKFGDKSFVEMIEQTILNSEQIEEDYELYKKKDKSIRGNLAIPYCILYDLMNTEQNIIVQYLKEIQKLKKEQN